ncbi:hypothetical protein MAPG_08448 [Magnaporthiopsis poae ATCC 64411]|uniref:Uncharacterized protein n=1 Tax=Magnaporthiopsis poae (strain ATCC 64411 / 73-15) TaxID=644358 RepID=A0A0C4E7D5_MAGP6|nr:hypothetical protein MAPG_08448 [Magnaporthiopsis poae ATCC 64411]
MAGPYRGKGRRQASKRKGPKQDEGQEPQPQAAHAEPSTGAAGRYRESLARLLQSVNAENAKANPAISAAANAADSAELQQAAMTMVDLAATAQDAQTVTHGHGNGNGIGIGNAREDIASLKTPSDFEAAFYKLVRTMKMAQYAVAQPDADHDNNDNKSMSPPTEEAAAMSIAEHEMGKAAAGMQAQATAFQMSHPAMIDPFYGRAEVGEQIATMQTSRPEMMNPVSGQTAVGEKPMVVHNPYQGMMDPTFRHAAVGGRQVGTIQTSHPAMMDPAFGQAAIGGRQVDTIQTSHPAMMDPAFGQAAVGEKPMVIHSANPAMMSPDFGHVAIGEQLATIQTWHPLMADPGFSQAARREQQHYRVHRIKAAENAPEKLLEVLEEFRDCLNERMTEFVVINGVMFDLGCGGPYR